MSRRSSASALASVALLAAWVGAAVFVTAVVTPAAFAVLPTRALAGALVRRVLPVLLSIGILLGTVVALLNRSMRAGRWASGGAFVVAGANTAALLVTIRLRATLAAMSTPMEALAPADPRRVAFGAMHALSVLLLGLGLAGACVAFATIARHTGTRSIS